MAGALIDRAFAILELLSAESGGVALSDIAARLDLPGSAAHRMLAELVRLGYARQDTATCAYMLTPKIVSLTYAWLGDGGAREAVRPALESLAKQTGELVRFAVVDGERLAWLASAQGARFGLRFEPEMGADVALYCTAAGCAWLACLSEEEALRLVMKQGFGKLVDDGPGAPRTIDALQNQIRLARNRGVARGIETSEAGITSLAVPVRHPGNHTVLGVLDISGPSARLGEVHLHELSVALLATAAEIAPTVGFACRSALPRQDVRSPHDRDDQYA